MKSIGGYFELELPQGDAYHRKAIALNTGRNCLEYILRVRQYKKVYIPYYTCEVILEPFNKLGIDYSFYHINQSLEIDRPFKIEIDEALLYTNYFGLKQHYIASLVGIYGKQLIVDNTQAFFAMPFEGIDTFYSCRKFFGVADGAYLYCDKALDQELEQDQSWQRMDYLLKRIDLSPEEGYGDFQVREQKLINQPIMLMSNLTKRIMSSIDYTMVAKKRRDNYKQLQSALGQSNRLKKPLAYDDVPMVYPYLTDHSNLHKRLINYNIYIAQFWPNVLKWCTPFDLGYNLTQCLLPLPIDQRYGKEDMEKILELFR